MIVLMIYMVMLFGKSYNGMGPIQIGLFLSTLKGSFILRFLYNKFTKFMEDSH